MALTKHQQSDDTIAAQALLSTADRKNSQPSWSKSIEITGDNHIDPLIKSTTNKRQSIQNQLQFWLTIAGFKTAHHYYIGFVFLYILLTTCINGWLIPQHSICSFLAITVFSFQFQSLILYCFGYYILNYSFKLHFVNILCDKHLSELHCNSRILFRKELIWTTVIMGFSYISGALIFFQYDKKTTQRFWYAVTTNIMDIFRYLPQIVHIALITSFFRAFLTQITYLRNKYQIPSRKQKQEHLKYIEIRFKDITNDLREMLYPYNVMMGKKRFTLWISSYMFLNVIIIVFFWASILSPDCSQSDQTVINMYYMHYLSELIANFVGWIFLVYPIYRCNAAISSLVADIAESNVIAEYNEYNAIMINLNQKVKHSPFSVGGWEVTVSRLARILLFVISTLIFDAVSNMGGFRFWNCN